jgi:hypothetical protein
MLLFSAVAMAGDLVPTPLRSAIIVRSAGYERGISERSGDAVLVVVGAKTGPAAEDAQAMAAVFTKLLRETRISGRKTKVVHIVHESVSKTITELKNARAEVVYFGRGLEALVKDVPMKESGTARILVCANGKEMGQGCTLGVELAGEKPRLVLNVKQANQAGLRFDPEFLRLARIVRQ